MKNAGSLIRIFFLFSIVFIGSCSNYQKLLKSDDLELKYNKAVEYYENEQYNKSITLLADVIPAFRGTARAEKVNYYYALAHYKQRDYSLASHYFSSFASAFPNSEHVEEFLYLSAYSKYLESPRPSLDQSSTLEAIQELQSFINRFPGSERVVEANELIDELRLKLETKRFDKAMMYLRINDYVAAATTFTNLIRDFPDTQYREEALFNIILCHFEYADQSIMIRQEERFEEVVKAYQALVRRYPESQYLTRAEQMRDYALNRMEEIKQVKEVSEK